MNEKVSAYLVAASAHVGQTDKLGTPYIRHPVRVAQDVLEDHRLPTGWRDVAYCAALLHDVVEDTYITLQDLEEFGFEGRVIQLVDYLTRQDEQNYNEYIQRILDIDDTLKRKFSLVVKLIKLADLKDNLSPARELPGKDAKGIKKRYLKTQLKLEESLIK